MIRSSREVNAGPFLVRILLFAVAAPMAAWAGAIQGTVKYEGRVPSMKPIEGIQTDPVCAKIHGDTLPVQDWFVSGEGQTLANVLVVVSGGLAAQEWPSPEGPVELTQTGCMYAPHVFVLRPGQKLRVLNPDGTLHNIHPLPKVNDEFNKAMPKERTEIELSFKKPEPVFEIKCDVHVWMRAYCAVLDHSFFAVTAKDGAFCIEGLDPGEYEVTFWHEVLGEQRATATVSADAPVNIDVVFTKPTKK
mgnify:CR=1 FL=1